MSASNTNQIPMSNDPDVNKIMLELEKKGEAQLAALMSPVKDVDPITKINYITTQKPDFGNNLISIMQNGAKEFKEQTGREMTYSEMRAMYG